MICENRIFDPEGHLTPFALRLLKAYSLTEEELTSVAGHISNCLICGEAFANSFAEKELMETPTGFIESIENKLENKLEDNPTKNNLAKNNKSLLFYSLRVGFAVCASIAMLFFTSSRFYADFETYTKAIKPPDLGFIQSINSGIRDFTQNILKMEVFHNETKKR